MIETGTIRLVRLADVAEINPVWDKGISPEDPVSFVGMASMSDELGKTVGEEPRTVSDVRTGYTPFRRDDLLVAKITPCFENGKIGRAAIAHPIGAGSTEFHVVRPGPQLDAGYALHFLRRPYFRAAGEPRMTGSGGQRRVPAAYVADTKIPLPPLDEQRRIAAILDKADELRTKRRQALAHLDALTQSIFHSMFGGMASAAVLSDAIAALTGGKNLIGSDDSRNSYRVLKISAVTSGRYIEAESKPLPDAYEPLTDHIVRTGDVIISRANTSELVGASALVASTNGRSVLPDKLWRAVPSSKADPRFLLATLQSPSVRAEMSRRSTGSGGSMKNISKPKLLSIPVALPPRELQETFAARVSAVERLKESHRKHLAELDALFASLQDRAFKGEL